MNSETSSNSEKEKALTQQAINNAFILADKLDRQFFGKRKLILVWYILTILYIAPIIDWYLGSNFKLTNTVTLLGVLFFCTVALSYVGSWRDEDDKWTKKRFREKLDITLKLAKFKIHDVVMGIRKKGHVRNMKYEFAYFVIKTSILIQGMNVIYKYINLEIQLIENISGEVSFVCTLLLVGGIFAILTMDGEKNSDHRKRFIQDLRRVLGIDKKIFTHSAHRFYEENLQKSNKFIYDLKSSHDYDKLCKLSNDKVYLETIEAIGKWSRDNSFNFYREKEYQDDLQLFFAKNQSNMKVISEFPIIDRASKRRRIDIVIDDTLAIEMKRDISTVATDRAKSQIEAYAKVWVEQGIIILLYCGADFEKVKEAVSDKMDELAKANYPVITIVA